MNNAARYYMIGGFLGAGKTTAVAALALHLTKRGERVGLITNDQGSELVDTTMLRARGFSTEEIPGGCFCCRFNSLVDAARKLTTASRPDAFVAEPVGSCTDLVATVSYPLRRIYGNEFRLAPLSVLVDPTRAEQVLGLREGRKFSEKVLYIWRKQVEEADLIVIAKSDLLDATRLGQLRERLGAEFPGKAILAVSVREGLGLSEWFEYLENSEARLGDTMTVDYDTYAEGEALLGWLNATADITTTEELDSGALLEALARRIQHELAASEIAHLKMTFSPDDGLGGEVAALSLVRSDFVPELSLRLEDPVRNGQLIVNCRAEADPAELRRALEAGLAALPGLFSGLSTTLVHAEQFRPGRPQPTHRLAHAGAAVVSA
jgi:G3E family GTPase